ncbi:MAG: amidohydrolase [Spirochaetaceae bacterium]|nr:amidohydrolase [Spirochaetaceae bacterium]|tara:strand:- start:353 stop:1201 length:849 start_codon:yes stop_codon:yes gene_type:complete
MQAFDFNVHVAFRADYLSGENAQTERASRSLRSEAEMAPENYLECLSEYSEEFQTSFKAANFMFFNPDLLGKDALTPALKDCKSRFPDSRATGLVDYRKTDQLDRLSRMKEQGFDCIKFHPYSQKITPADWSSIVKIAKHAESLSMAVLVCTSFGTSRMHDHDGIGLACELADSVSSVPIVLMHSGGVRAYEAMLLAEDKKNVYLETSFSLPYFEGGPIWDDLAFIYRKIGTERVLFGSDFPYVGLDENRRLVSKFFDRYRFKEAEQTGILEGNALRLFSSL